MIKRVELVTNQYVTRCVAAHKERGESRDFSNLITW